MAKKTQNTTHKMPNGMMMSNKEMTAMMQKKMAQGAVKNLRTKGAKIAYK